MIIRHDFITIRCDISLPYQHDIDITELHNGISGNHCFIAGIGSVIFFLTNDSIRLDLKCGSSM